MKATEILKRQNEDKFFKNTICIMFLFQFG